MVHPLKDAIRKTLRKVRESLPESYQQMVAHKIISRIRHLDDYRQARHIAFYYATQGEVDLSHLWQTSCKQGKYCYFPALNDNFSLIFLPATLATPFKANRYHINEPAVASNTAIELNTLDIIFLPLVAFDDSGTRLGMGAGYYDRTLAAPHNACLIGIGYEFQHLSFIHKEPWDIPLSVIITEKGIYWRKP